MSLAMRRVVIAGTALGSLTACTTSNVDTAPTEPATTTTSTTIPPTTTAAATTTVAPATTARPTTARATTTTARPATTMAPTTTSPPPGAALVLAETGIRGAAFGTDADGVVDYVSSIIGGPAADSGWADASAFEGCPGTVVRIVSWDDLSLFFGDGADDEERGRREFFGYRYGTGADGTASPAGPAIDGGITVGSTVRQLLIAYPSAGIDPGGDDDPATFTVIEGLSGYLTAPDDDGVVTQIVGGLVCGD
jgi:hypothetical protein